MTREAGHAIGEWSDGISDIEGQAARVAASERSRGAASDIDGQTERSKCAGAHELIGQRTSFKSEARTRWQPRTGEQSPRRRGVGC